MERHVDMACGMWHVVDVACGFICLENHHRDLEPSIMIHADSVSFLASSDDRIQKDSSMFGLRWTNPSVNSQKHIKK